MATDAGAGEQSLSSDVLNLAADKARRYVRDIPERRVSPSEAALTALSELMEPFPSLPSDPCEVITRLDEIGSAATVATTGGRYFGFVNGGMVPAALAANWLAAAWNQNAALRVMSPIGAELEEVVLRWVCEALGLPPECEGGLVTCATMANFTALVTARHALLARAGWDVTADGMFGAPPLDVVVGAEAHASILKGLSLAGFGSKRVTIVEADGQGRMRANKLPPLSERTIVCIQAGNVNTGAFDPAAEICKAAKEQGAWVHVDGAFGLWARISRKYEHLTRGFDQADSWATDAHKWPNVGYDSGLAIVRDGTALRASMGITAAYLEAGFTVLNDVVINQVLVSFGRPEVTREVIRRVQEEGTCWCGGTVWQEKTAMRISVSSWATTETDVEHSLRAILRIASECLVYRTSCS